MVGLKPAVSFHVAPLIVIHLPILSQHILLTVGETKTPATPKTLSEEMQAPQMPLYSRAAAHWPPLPHTVNGSDQDTAAVVTGGDVSNPPNVFRDMHDMHASDGLTGYGTFLSTGTNVPVIVAPGVPFVDRFQMHRDVTGMQGMVHVLQYTRDEGPGGHVKLNGEVWLVDAVLY